MAGKGVREKAVNPLAERTAELGAERARVLDKIGELDERLKDEAASVHELRVIAGELSDARQFVGVLDAQLRGIVGQQRQIDDDARKERLVGLHEVEREAYDVYLEALDALEAGPQARLLAAQLAIHQAGGFGACDHGTVPGAIRKLKRHVQAASHFKALGF